jgi:hypothetical protein
MFQFGFFAHHHDADLYHSDLSDPSGATEFAAPAFNFVVVADVDA